MAIVVNPLNRWGWTRDQAAAPSYLRMISGQTLRCSRGKPVPIFPDHALMLEIPRLQAAGRTENDDRRVLLVFGRRRYLGLGQLERDAVTLVGNAPKPSAPQSTTIFRLPTPRKPPKSITAARTLPERSTITSTMRPMSSFAALRTSRPRMPWASLAPITVTDGGGAGSFAASGGGVRLPCVPPVSSAA